MADVATVRCIANPLCTRAIHPSRDTHERHVHGRGTQRFFTCSFARTRARVARLVLPRRRWTSRPPWIPPGANILSCCTCIEHLSFRRTRARLRRSMRCMQPRFVSCSSPPLRHGTAVVVTRAPPFLKSADAMSSLRRGDLVEVGEPGRVVDRRPKDVWAVRFRAGTFLIDRKYIEPLMDAESEAMDK